MLMMMMMSRGGKGYKYSSSLLLAAQLLSFRNARRQYVCGFLFLFPLFSPRSCCPSATRVGNTSFVVFLFPLFSPRSCCPAATRVGNTCSGLLLCSSAVLLRLLFSTEIVKTIVMTVHVPVLSMTMMMQHSEHC